MPSSDPEPRLVTPSVLRDWPLPLPTGGKEARGTILVVGGSREVPGAVVLAAEAALRAGAGRLQVATAESAASLVAAALPEALVRALPETDAGAIRGAAASRLRELAEGAGTVLIGPGLQDVEQTRDLVHRLLDHAEGSVVLDALGLTSLTDDDARLASLAGRAVFTPNPTELAFALHRDEDQVESDPARAAQQLARQTGAVVGLGGATSWIAAPDGQLWRDDSGSAGLGVSGSGDVRAGLTAGLLARGADPAQAAVWAAFLHGRAGERLSETVGRLGFLAREIPPEIPRLIDELLD
jgi:ADP-dependent NAD(P)H-hydrate dehydratase